MPPRLAALATAVPPYTFSQEAVLDRLRQWLPGSARLAHLLPVFENSGIERRYSAAPLDWFAEPRGWRDRQRVYADTALDLIETVAGRLLDASGIRPDDIGGVVTVSTTGIATPSLDALLIERMRLPRNVRRLPIFGLGCAGGVIGLGRAAEMAAADPSRPVLFLVVELCTLAFRHGDDSKSDIVADALFGDGAAGALLSCHGPGPAIVASGEHTWPDSLGVMGWDIADDGFRAIFSRDIPHLVTTELGAAAASFLARQELGIDAIDRFICHPGGPKVITACEGAFGLPAGTLDDARDVLRGFGNMSAATVLFVLDRALAAGPPWRRALMTALGPGFSAGFVLLENR